MYGKIFESIFDSTLVADGGWLPTYVFMSMVVVADQNGIVDVAPKALYSRMGFREYDSKITYKDFCSALEYLGQQDSFSKSSAEGGKRIIPLSEVDEIDGNRGWLIVNYMKYRNLANREDRTQQNTERSRRFRAKKANKNNDETHCNALQPMQRHTDTDTDTNKEVRKRAPRRSRTPPEDFQLTQELKEWALQEAPDIDVEAEYRTFMDHEFDKPRSQWVKTFRNWIRRAQKFNGKNQRRNGPSRYEQSTDKLRQWAESGGV